MTALGESPDVVSDDVNERTPLTKESPKSADINALIEMVNVKIGPESPEENGEPTPSVNNGWGSGGGGSTSAGPSVVSAPTNYFKDGKRRIDYVFAYKPEQDANDTVVDEEAMSSVALASGVWERAKEIFVSARKEVDSEFKRHAKRQLFETNLAEQGLELEFEPLENSHDGETVFVKVHAPWEVLARQAEVLKIKMPIKERDIQVEDNLFKGCINNVLKRIHFLRLDIEEEQREYYTAPFMVERQHQFIFKNNDKDKFFPFALRSRMVYDILIRTQYDPLRTDRVGIERMVKNGAYVAAYPLHEGEYFPSKHDEEVASKPKNDRQLLYENWARPAQLLKFQPLDKIRNYFGEKIAIYFAWLGFYTKHLFPAAAAGLFCVIYGLATVFNDKPSSDICQSNLSGDTIMCPNCDHSCGFWSLKDSCRYSQLTHVFDNELTVLFAAFMSVWASLFLEGWKRYRSEIAWEWDLMEFDIEEETIRPEFAARVKQRRINPITKKQEPFLPLRTRACRLLTSGVSVLFFLCLLLAFVFGIIVYRIIIVHVLFGMPSTGRYATILTTASASMLNLIIILVLGRVYQNLARQLTEWEFPRTQTDFDNSYTFKVFLFQFINYYSSLFYTAFLKGRLAGVPGSVDREQGAEVAGYRFESCDPAGCMVELVIQLFIIMVGKQFFSGFMEIGFPIMWNWISAWKLQVGKTVRAATGGEQQDSQANGTDKEQTTEDIEKDDRLARWEKDFALNAVPDQFMFFEYLEMVIQYGFVTLFVAAFPLAPMFALLNNILEIRLDGFKYTVTYRRPMPARARDLGVWHNILDAIGNIAVLVNACVIGFTSDFVPRLIYVIRYSPDGTLSGFIEHSLAYINSANITVPSGNHYNICRYRDYRKPPCSLVDVLPTDDNTTHRHVECDNQYGYSLVWWHVLASRFIFVLVFEHFVFLVKGAVQYLIPDMPERIFINIQREMYLAKQARLAYELEKTQDMTPAAEERMKAARRLYGLESSRDSAETRPDVAAMPPGAIPPTVTEQEVAEAQYHLRQSLQDKKRTPRDHHQVSDGSDDTVGTHYRTPTDSPELRRRADGEFDATTKF